MNTAIATVITTANTSFTPDASTAQTVTIGGNINSVLSLTTTDGNRVYADSNSITGAGTAVYNLDDFDGATEVGSGNTYALTSARAIRVKNRGTGALVVTPANVTGLAATTLAAPTTTRTSEIVLLGNWTIGASSSLTMSVSGGSGTCAFDIFVIGNQ
jgi:hypothetical protein